MMDAYNLAICFGPTLMPAPEDKDQVQYQNQVSSHYSFIFHEQRLMQNFNNFQVNELIKNIIVYHEDVFPKDLGGTIYEKYISSEPFEEWVIFFIKIGLILTMN